MTGHVSQHECFENPIGKLRFSHLIALGHIPSCRQQNHQANLRCTTKVMQGAKLFEPAEKAMQAAEEISEMEELRAQSQS